MFEVQAGENIHTYVQRVKSLLLLGGIYQTDVKFNDITIRVYANSNQNDVVEKYLLCSELRRHGISLPR